MIYAVGKMSISSVKESYAEITFEQRTERKKMTHIIPKECSR